MKQGYKNIIRLLLFVCMISVVFIQPKKGRADITSVTLTPAIPTTLSNGKSYYVAGVQYTFRVRAVDPEATQDTDWNQIALEFRENGTTRASCTINIGSGSDTVGAQSGVVVDTIDRTHTSNWSNLDYYITLRFRWDVTDYNAAAVNDVRATVSEDVAPASNMTATVTFNYGVCASIAVRNFAMDGVAADGRINPWHSAFNVTGAIVYYVAGESITDKVETVDSGEITGTTLLLDGGATAMTDNAMGDDLSYALAAEYMNTNGVSLGNHAWRVRATMNTAGGPEDSVVANQLTFNLDRVQVTAITFSGGGGIDSPYYRSVNIPGTQINVTAQTQNGGGTMVGNTTIRLSDGTNTYDVQIPSGQNSASALLAPYPGVAITPDGATTLLTYQVVAVFGGAYDNEQNIAARISQPASPQIYWDRNDPPGANSAPFTPWLGTTVTAYSMTLNWTPLTPGAPDFDADFYTYRIYYKKQSDSTWTMIDRTTADYGTGGTYRLDLITTGSATITGLSALTIYDYYVTAVDVFGQEVAVNVPASSNAAYDHVHTPGAPYYDSANTSPSSLEVSITDGIDVYNDSSFTADAKASARPLRKTAIRVSLFVVAAQGIPDSVNLIIASDGSGDLWTSGTGLNGAEGVDYYRITCEKSAANKWKGYIPETNPLITLNSSVRFIVETIKDNVANYADHNSELETPPGNPNDYEYAFAISKEVKFTPWPTRILNNVITDKNPLAYPAFYLSDDALVTIKAYDIKGRPVATLLENGFRKGGQNIKEGGWGGTNRSGKKLGPGLYYINIKARRQSDGKVILNENEKVVVAR
jgi:hypothetical protein